MWKKKNYTYADILIFSESMFSSSDPDVIYKMDGYSLFRNDDTDYGNLSYHGRGVYYEKPMLSWTLKVMYFKISSLILFKKISLKEKSS